MCKNCEKRLAKDETVCELCRVIFKTANSFKFVDSITWGSISGRPIYGICCPKCFDTKINKDSLEVIGRAYA